MMQPSNTLEIRPVLVMHSDAATARDLCHRLQFLDFPTVQVEAIERPDFAAQDYTAIITDARMLRRCAEDRRRKLRTLLQSTPALLLGDGEPPARDPEAAAPLWQIELPLRRARLAHLLKQAQAYRGKQRRQRLTGASSSISEVRQLIEQVAGFDTGVLINGESGTGKELVARTIHDLSTRADGPFVPVNCGAIPAELLESELFGHEKGAFTGAVAARPGRFELAEGGTLFLDEIGDMPLPMQVKLLRVLQERAFTRVGSGKVQHCNVRIVAATHRELPELVRAGRFREDLFYRLNVFPIKMPALRKRLEDLPDLLSELVLGHGDGNGKRLRLRPCALTALASYDWPGNVRELGNLVERLAILHPTGVVRMQDLPQKFRAAAPAVAGAAADVAVTALPEGGLLLKEHLQSVERSLIDDALTRCDGVVARAARLLHMRRTTLVEKLRLA